MSQYPVDQATSAIAEYTPRATEYDASNQGWHASLADHFIDWMKPQPGDTVLDLACGTGLVTIRMARAVGASGHLIGVDITPAMLEVARATMAEESLTCAYELVEADITNPKIRDVDPIKTVLEREGGFDIVSCCSAVVLLGDPGAAVKLWAGMLKSGGKMILDVPTGKLTVQYISTELIGRDIGIEFPFSRAWIKGKASVEKLFSDAGMEVTECFETDSYLPVKVYGEQDGDEVFDRDVLRRLDKMCPSEGLREKAREAWRKWWRTEVEVGDGEFVDGHWLYVCHGRKL